MYSEEVTVKEVVAHLNELVGGVVGKIVSGVDLQNQVILACDVYLKSLGLEFGMGGAKLRWSAESDIRIWSALFTYAIPCFVQDKRVKRGLTGKLEGSPVWSARYENGVHDHKNPIVVIPADDWTLRRYVLECERADRKAHVEASEKWLAKCREDVMEAMNRVSNNQTDLANVESVIDTEFPNRQNTIQ